MTHESIITAPPNVSKESAKWRWAIVASKVATTVVAVSALSATIHIIAINTDLHTWLQEPTPLSLKGGNPFAGFAQQLGRVLASKIQIIPGVGLYVLEYFGIEELIFPRPLNPLLSALIRTVRSGSTSRNLLLLAHAGCFLRVADLPLR